MNRIRGITLRFLVGAILLWLLLAFYPVRTVYFRAALALGLVAILGGLTVVLWRHRFWRWVPMVVPAVVVLALLAPGRVASRAILRRAYMAELRSYLGVRYVWGGENGRGVDCSGLVRAALIGAHFKEAIRSGNPMLARRGLWFWWNDAAARDLGDFTHHALTRRLAADATLRDVPLEALLPGDLAVTSDGSHVLAYAGEGHWIEADPYTLRVIELAPGVESEWWGIRVTPCRWRCLDAPSSIP
jgi:cell wall-associated NlpC family hydrolase